MATAQHHASLVGERVLLHGISARPELNGTVGRAVSFSADKGRYTVDLGEGVGELSVKPSNCSLYRGPGARR